MIKYSTKLIQGRIKARRGHRKADKMYGWNGKSYSKYKNRKVQVDGIIFDSAKEANRYKELNMMEKAGKIKGLQRQVKYVLIPAQREPAEGKKKGKLLERECAYLADFVYFDNDRGEYIVEDVKGYRGGGAYEVFKIKRKLMLYRFGIHVTEI